MNKTKKDAVVVCCLIAISMSLIACEARSPSELSNLESLDTLALIDAYGDYKSSLDSDVSPDKEQLRRAMIADELHTREDVSIDDLVSICIDDNFGTRARSVFLMVSQAYGVDNVKLAQTLWRRSDEMKSFPSNAGNFTVIMVQPFLHKYGLQTDSVQFARDLHSAYQAGFLSRKNVDDALLSLSEDQRQTVENAFDDLVARDKINP